MWTTLSIGFLLSMEYLCISFKKKLTITFMFPIVPRGSFDTVIAAKHDAVPPTVSAKSTDKKGTCYIFSVFKKWNNLSNAMLYVLFSCNKNESTNRSKLKPN